MTPYVMVMVTAKDADQAERIVQQLLKKKLIACANMIKGVQSVFWWDKKIDQCEEVIVVMKSRHSEFQKIVECVRAEHSYEVPEVIALPILDGNQAYLNWIDESLG